MPGEGVCSTCSIKAKDSDKPNGALLQDWDVRNIKEIKRRSRGVCRISFEECIIN